jgi:hypothetical protein
MSSWIWKEFAKGLIAGLCVVAFLWFTGWKGFVGFVVGSGVTAYLLLTNNYLLMATTKTLEDEINKWTFSTPKHKKMKNVDVVVKEEKDG